MRMISFANSSVLSRRGVGWLMDGLEIRVQLGGEVAGMVEEGLP